MTSINEICKSIKDNNKELFRNLIADTSLKLPKKECNAILESITYKRINYLKTLLKDNRFSISQEAFTLAYETNFKILQLLYKSIKKNNKKQETYMFFSVFNKACYSSNLEVVQFFIDNEDTLYSYDNTELQIACRDNNIEVVKLILNSKQYRYTSQISKNREPMSIALLHNNFDIFKLLCEDQKINEDIKIHILSYLLSESIRNKKSDFTQYIIGFNYPMDFFKNYCNCPLSAAVVVNDFKLFQSLYNNKNMTFTPFSGYLSFCLEHDAFDIAKFLIDKKIIGTKSTQNTSITNNIFLSPKATAFLLQYTNIDLSIRNNKMFKMNFDNRNYDVCSLLLKNKNVYKKMTESNLNKYWKILISKKIELF